MRNLYRLLPFLLAVIFSTELSYGAYPLVRNFGRTAYGGGTQNWCIDQDSLGRIWVANRDGLLMYDGNIWRKAYLDNYGALRGVRVDTRNNRVWACGSNTFGYFEPDARQGRFVRYVSLTGMLPEGTEVGEVWRIHNSSDRIFFVADFRIYEYDGNHLRVYSSADKITASAYYKGHIYICSSGLGLCRLDGGQIVDIDTGDADMAHAAMMGVYDNSRLVILTSFDGAYEFDGHTLKPFLERYRDYMVSGQGFSLAMRNRLLAIGTVRNGGLIVDMENPDAAPSFLNQLS